MSISRSISQLPQRRIPQPAAEGPEKMSISRSVSFEPSIAQKVVTSPLRQERTGPLLVGDTGKDKGVSATPLSSVNIVRNDTPAREQSGFSEVPDLVTKQTVSS
jgi:hypothetical protein